VFLLVFAAYAVPLTCIELKDQVRTPLSPATNGARQMTWCRITNAGQIADI
jgi:hypothetical protein